jgi:hypothetical protein
MNHFSSLIRMLILTCECGVRRHCILDADHQLRSRMAYLHIFTFQEARKLTGFIYFFKLI